MHHGIDIPLFSLHSKESSGIGEYPDLIPIISWCKQIGFDVIQLLPLNDTGLETSPYSAISAFALNPWHLRLNTPVLDCKSQRVDYKKVFKEKGAFLNQYCKKHADTMRSTASFKKFFQENQEWLKPYIAYKGEYGDILQYLCFEQMKEVKAHADKEGVMLKGDIPILINRDSIDVEQNPEIFLQEYSAGSPPDRFTPDGQDWAFPIYNWDALEKRDYVWWKKRLHVAEQFFHIYRLDHIVGFYRIFAIPEGLTAHEGIFIPEDEDTWVGHGEKILKMMLQTSKMIPIGEDLAVIPNSIRESLRKLGICGTRVIRWERTPDGSYIKYQDYIPESMTTVSTHDAETLQVWWQDYPDEAKAFAKFKGWEYHPNLSKEQHRQILYDSHHTASTYHINLLNEYLYLIDNMTWPNIQDERINYPGTISDLNWTYRFRPSVEEIVSSNALSEIMKSMV